LIQNWQEEPAWRTIPNAGHELKWYSFAFPSCTLHDNCCVNELKKPYLGGVTVFISGEVI
jgi:hypothetical protein